MKFGSLFAGVGGFDMGLEAAGMVPAWQVEFDPKAQAVLRKHWPDVDLHSDVRDVGESDLASVELICGGFPCQDLSVAGKRAGLAGERSGLFHEFMRIVGALTPTWVLIENVTGLRSGCGCVDCGAVARILRIHERVRRRSGGEPCATCRAGRSMLKSHSGRNLAVVVQRLAELGYGWGMRSFDTQYFGPPQRRERVFIVGHLGGFCPPEVLFEAEGVPWNSPPDREAQRRVAATLTRGADSSGKGGYAGRRREDDVNLVTSPLTTKPYGDNVSQASKLVVDPGFEVAGTLGPRPNRQSTDEVANGASVVLAMRSDASRSGVAKTPSPDAEGRVRLRDPGFRVEEEVAPTLDTGPGHTVFRKARKAHDPSDHERWEEAEHTNTLTGHSTTQGEVVLPIAFQPGDLTRGKGSGPSSDTVPTLVADAEQGDMTAHVSDGVAPRRLTPRECERLQGWPDDHTRFGVTPEGETVEISDSARYRMIGNGVSQPVAEWIGRRIMAHSGPHADDDVGAEG